MNKSIVCIAIAGFAVSASAQDFSLTILAPNVFDGLTTITLDIIGDASVGTHMLGGGFGLSTNSSSLVTNITWTPASWSAFNTDGGYDGNGNYNQIIFGQLVIPGVPPFDVPAAGSGLGMNIGSFQIELTQPLNLMTGINFSFVTYGPFSLEVVDINTGQTYQDIDGNLILNGLSVPTPSSLALLGLGGLAVGRRRR